MKTTLPYLKNGDRVVAEVVEKVTVSDYIASFNGDLIRITNNTGRSLQTGEKISLEVQSINPLKFRLQGPRPLLKVLG